MLNEKRSTEGLAKDALYFHNNLTDVPKYYMFDAKRILLTYLSESTVVVSRYLGVEVVAAENIFITFLVISILVGS